MNPLLAVPRSGESWIPYYRDGAGLVCLSLGDDMELGGEVSGYVRRSSFVDATVMVGDSTWVRDGQLAVR